MSPRKQITPDGRHIYTLHHHPAYNPRRSTQAAQSGHNVLKNNCLLLELRANEYNEVNPSLHAAASWHHTRRVIDTPQMAEEEQVTTEPTAQDALADVTYTLAHLNDAFATLEECIDANLSFPPDSVDLDEIKKLMVQIDEQDRKIKESLAEMQKSLLDEADKQAAASTDTALKTYAAEWIKEEVGLQVKEQVDLQIVEHLPESLQKQADDSKRQLEEMKVSLKNSESRMVNSYIQNSNTSDRLAVLLNAEGQKSPLYPANSRSLFGYDLDSAKSLCKDYDLPESDDLLVNFRQFLKHVGTDIEVGVSP